MPFGLLCSFPWAPPGLSRQGANPAPTYYPLRYCNCNSMRLSQAHGNRLYSNAPRTNPSTALPQEEKITKISLQKERKSSILLFASLDVSDRAWRGWCSARSSWIFITSSFQPDSKSFLNFFDFLLCDGNCAGGFSPSQDWRFFFTWIIDYNRAQRMLKREPSGYHA